MSDAETIRERDTLRKALETAWAIIANVSGGDWTKQTPEWQEAAKRWRDEQFHPAVSPPQEGEA